MKSDSDPNSDQEIDTRNRLLESGAPHSIRRVSISQLHKADLPHSNALFRINNRPVKKLMVVGIILNKKETDRQISYTIDDGSAQIIARYWRDPSTEARDEFEYSDELRYVRAVGELNEYKMEPGRKLRSLILQPGSLTYVQDVYEPFFHTLHVLIDTQTALYGSPPVAPAEPNDHTEPQSELAFDATENEELEGRLQNHSDSVPETPAKVRNARLLPPPSPTPRPRRTHSNAEAGPSKQPTILPLIFPSDQKYLSSSKTLAEVVVLVIGEGMNALRLSHPSSAYDGMSRKAITDEVLKRRHVSSSQINEAISYLKDEGEIYETIDEHHFDLT